MPFKPTYLLLAIVCLAACAAPRGASDAANRYDVIPLPAQLEPKSGAFVLDAQTAIATATRDADAARVVAEFGAQLRRATGLPLPAGTPGGKRTITFELTDAVAHPEGYEISVTPTRVAVTARQAQGLFYAVQTLYQLLPDAVFADTPSDEVAWRIPSVEIADAPRFVYRGMHLDVARHFFDVAAVKQYIDQLAFHKMNYFHWHLTDDQGWRIEIKRYPKLTEVGGYRNGTLIGHYNDQPQRFSSTRYGGFYTQADISEVVAYAAARFVTVVPEIEMPGHAQAVLAAYPELGCGTGPYEVWQKWGVSDNVFCPTEQTFTFLQNVLDEVVALFPSPYIHIGGDECPKLQWEQSAFCQQLIKDNNLGDAHGLQSYFIRRIEAYLNTKGKKIIGWDEILEGGLAPNATVMSWRGIEGGIAAAKAGHDVVMTPTSHCYLDYYQSDHPEEPLAIGGFLPLAKVYAQEPIPAELTADEAKHILGTQGNLWTEYIPTLEKLHYMAFPRMCALAEVAWTPATRRDYNDFVVRLLPHLARLNQRGIGAANHLFDIVSTTLPDSGKVVVTLAKLAPVGDVFYTTDGSAPSSKSERYTGSPIAVDSACTLRAAVYWDGQPQGRPWQQQVRWHLAAGKPATLAAPPHEKYSGQGPGSLTNGVSGSTDRYGDAEWLGFGDGQDFEVTLDLGQSEYISKVGLRFFNGEGQWIYLPTSVVVSTSEDGVHFDVQKTETAIRGSAKVVPVAMTLKAVPARYVRIRATNYGTIPAGRQGAGNGAWLFVDEVVIE